MANKKGRSGERFRKVKINRNNIGKYNRKEYSKIIFLAVFLLAIVCGTSYAFLTDVFNSTKTVEVTAGTFKVEFEEGNNIDMKNAVPMTNEEGMNTESYTFTIRNDAGGTLDAKYDISLEENDQNTLDRKYVKYSIKEGDGEWSTPALLSSGLSLKTGRTLAVGEVVTYELKLWLDEDADNDAQGKSYGAKIVVNAIQTNATIKDFTTPIILLNGAYTVQVNQGEEFTDLGVSSIKDDREELNASDVSVTYEYYNGTDTVSVTGVDTTQLGVYYIYYKISDSQGNVGTTVRTVVVSKKDNNLPTISLIGDEVVTIGQGEDYKDTGAMASDKEDGELTKKIVTVGQVNTKVSGTYIIKYLVEDSDGNVSSVTRTVIVQPVVAGLKVNISYDDSDISQAIIDVLATTGASNAKYALTDEDKKPANKEYEDLDKTDDGFTKRITITRNGTYYLWVKDSNRNIKKNKIVVTHLDQEKPTCTFENKKYAGMGVINTIDLICEDNVAVKEHNLTDLQVTISNKDIIDNFDISSPECSGKQCKWTLSVIPKPLEDLGEFNITLLEDVVSDKNGNTNEKVTSGTIKVIDLVLSNGTDVTLDINGTKTHQIEAKVEGLGENVDPLLTYKSSDESVATVSSDGKITGIKPGAATITVTEGNGNSTKKVNVEVQKTVTATFKLNGTGVTSIGDDKKEVIEDECVLTKESTVDYCDFTPPTMELKSGYSEIGWNTDKTAHVGLEQFRISDNTTFYSISMKDEIELTAVFEPNGASLSSNEAQKCILDAVYNDDVQETSCTVVAPIITGSDNTPIVVGFKEESPTMEEDEVLDLTSNGRLTLTEKNNGHKWYAITTNTEKVYVATFEKNGNGIDSIGELTDSNSKCIIPKTYNGVKQNSTCKIEQAPSITTVSDDYEALGWNTDSTSHEGSYSLELSDHTTFYTISKKSGVTYTATLHKNGAGVDELGSSSVSCTTSDVYNDEAEETSCEVSSLPSFTVFDGYEALGWSQNNKAIEESTVDDIYALNGYHLIGSTIELNKNTDLYSISKKKSVTYSVNFEANGTSITPSGKVECTIDEVYNDSTQADSCKITIPSIERESFDILGFSTNKDSQDTNKDSYYQPRDEFEINASNNDTTYYAITKKDISIEWNGNGASLSSTKTTGTIWNTADSASIISPTITRDGYEKIGFNLSKDATESTWDQNTSKVVNLDNDGVTYYAITSKDVEAKFNYYDGTKQAIVKETCTMYNTDSNCSYTLPTTVSGSSGPSSTKYLGVSDSVSSTDGITDYNSDTTNYYAYYEATVPVTFYYYNGSGQTSIEVNGNRTATTDGTAYSVENSEITIPTDVSNSSGPSSSTYQGVSISKSSTTAATRVDTENTIYYTYYLGSWKVSYTKGDGIASIGSTSDTCDSNKTTDGNKYSESTCSIKLPTITASSGYTASGWYDGSSKVGDALDDYTISKSVSLVALTTANKYTVTYDYATNGGTSADVTSADVAYGAAVNLDVGAVKSGYTFVGWNTDANATEALTSLTMNTSNLKLYAIFEKSVTANFYYYDGTAQAKDTQTCTMYNNQANCSYTLPTAVSNSSGPNSTTYAGLSSTKGTITDVTTYNSNITDYYVYYRLNVDATFYYYKDGAQVSAIASGVRTATTNGTTYSTTEGNISIPTAVSSSSGPNSTEYEGVSTSKSSTLGTTTINTATTEYYAYYQLDVEATFYYFSGSAQTSATASGTRTATTNGTTYSTAQGSISIPTVVKNSSAANSISYKGVSSSVSSTTSVTPTTATVTYYAYYQGDVETTFLYYDGSAQATATASGTRTITTNGTSYSASNGQISIPTEVSNSTGPKSTIYKGLSTTRSDNSIVKTPTTSNTVYYTVYESNVTATFYYYKNGFQLASSSTGVRSATTDGATYSTTEGSINIPSVVSSSSGPDSTTYKGVSTTKSSTSGTTTLTTATTTYYAYYQASITAEFCYYSGSTARSTTASGTRSATTDGTTYSTTEGSISIPSEVSSSSGPNSTEYEGVSTSKSSTLGTTTINTATTEYYAYYQLDVEATFYYFSESAQTSTTASGIRSATYNGATYLVENSNLSIPSEVSSSTGPDSTTYKGVSTSKNSTSGTTTINTATTAYYTYYQAPITATFYYYSGSAQTSTTASGIRSATTDGTTYSTAQGTINIPSAVSSSSGPNSTTYNGVAASPNSTSFVSTPSTGITKYYAYYHAYITVVFYYYNGSAQASASISGSRFAKTNGTTYLTTQGSVSIPSVVSSSTGLNSAAYYGVSSSVSSTTTTSPTTGSTKFYTVYKGSWTATFSKGAGVDSISSTTSSCDSYKVTNGTTYSSKSCTISGSKLPTATVASPNSFKAWVLISGSGDPASVAAGGKITLSGNASYEAQANIIAEGVSYSNSSYTKCTNAQCAIDEINTMLN